jgi:hypothetical protein
MFYFVVGIAFLAGALFLSTFPHAPPSALADSIAVVVVLIGSANLYLGIVKAIREGMQP